MDVTKTENGAVIALDEPPEWTRRQVELRLEQDEQGRVCVHHQDGEGDLLPALRLSVERRSRRLRVDLTGPERLVVQMPDGEIIRETAPSVHSGGYVDLGTPDEKVREELAALAARTRNWEVAEHEDGRVLRVWETQTDARLTVELPILSEPSPLAPRPTIEHPIYEPIGQPEMLYALALSLRLSRHILLTGPTGTAKTSAVRWMAWMLGYGLVLQPISRGTQDRHLVGEYAPAGVGDFQWTDGATTRAVRASQTAPCVLLYDELNRIGNVAEFSRIYSLLDDTRMLELPERRHETGEVEVVRAGELFVCATQNPVDDENGDYVGARELDAAFSSRFPIQPQVGYPTPEHEAVALRSRVNIEDVGVAGMMVAAANRIRESDQVRFPISFREIEAWARLAPFMGLREAAEVAVVSKAAPMFRESVRGILHLSGL